MRGKMMEIRNHNQSETDDLIHRSAFVVRLNK